MSSRRSWAIEANIGELPQFAGDLQFGNRMARSGLSRQNVRMSDVGDRGLADVAKDVIGPKSDLVKRSIQFELSS